ncbi:MAG: YdiU family protein [Lysobacterales bacterium]
MQLQYDQRWIEELPGDPERHVHPRQVHGALWSPVMPTPVAAPRLLAWSSTLRTLLRLDDLDDPTGSLGLFAGNRLLPGWRPWSSNYGGHQFGHWAGQLGDGRAISLVEGIASDGQRLELQLKGAGPTPYSRRADGRAVLRSSLREFICSEAMHHLGVPTTRALCLVATGESVERDMFYDGRPQLEPGAIVCRAAPSFIRFGHFELPASRGDVALLTQLVDFCIDRDFPHLRGQPDARERWFGEVCERTAELVAHWLRVGFVHGVMNTDNLSILGLTIDYGPYGWLEQTDPDWTPNTTDFEGRRYCFGRQPQIALWNLTQLAGALLDTVLDREALQAGLARYQSCFAQAQQRHNLAKLGLRSDETGLSRRWWALLQAAALDYTLAHRWLMAPVEQIDIDALAAISYDPAAFQRQRPDLHDWLQAYRAQLTEQGIDDSDRLAPMRTANPLYVPRNYLAQLAIDAASAGDPGELQQWQAVLRRPYEVQEGAERFAAPRPEWARHRPGCSMLSCSS